MSTVRPSPLIRFLQIALLLSGWVVAAWVALRESSFESGQAKSTSEAVQDGSLALEDDTPAGKVERLFKEWEAKPEFHGAAIGFCLLDENGTPLFTSPMATVGMCPASSFKTLTSGAALNLLGLDFRFTTVLAGTSAIQENGALEGDLILVGGGDPTLLEEDLAKMASEAVAAGLKSVSGRLLVDSSVFPEHPANDFWNWGDIGNAYGAGAYGLNVDHNTLSISFEPGTEVGAPAQVLKAGPVPRDVHWINYVTTGNEGSGDQVIVYSEPYGRRITLRGTVPKGESRHRLRPSRPIVSPVSRKPESVARNWRSG